MKVRRIYSQIPEARRSLSLLLCFITVVVTARDIVLIDQQNKAPRSEREAILILPGFGDLYHSSKNQVKNFKDKGYDVFIPDYISRKSLDNCVKKLDGFVKKHKLGDYKKVHVFSYIIGSWTINSWIKQNSAGNIATIVYDRSPLQERVPVILVKTNPFLSRLLFGKLIRELSVTPYPSLNESAISCGLLIECKATKILWKKRKAYRKMEPVSFDRAVLKQESRDFFYIFLNHDDLYTHLESAAPQILYFFRENRFSPDADREPCTKDPFEPFRK